MPYVHHTIIHFVVALSLVAAAFHIAASLKRGSGWSDSARPLTFLATAAALVAAGSGLLSAGHAVEQGGNADKIAMHRNVALVATALMVIGAIAVWQLARQASVVNAWLARGFLLVRSVTDDKSNPAPEAGEYPRADRVARCTAGIVGTAVDAAARSPPGG